MTSSPEHRLESWRAVVETGQPYWLVELAPYIIRQLEAEVCAQADRSPEGEKPQALNAKHESAVESEASDAPKHAPGLKPGSPNEG